MNSSGRIELIMGPVFSGKTVELMRRVQRLTVAGKRCGIFKYGSAKDFPSLCSHEGTSVSCYVVDNMADFKMDFAFYDVIAIDMAHLIKDVPEFALKQALAGQTIIIAAVDADAKQQLFPNVAKILPHVDILDKLAAICMCSNEAPFTMEVHMGLYQPVCRICLTGVGFPVNKTVDKTGIKRKADEMEEFKVVSAELMHIVEMHAINQRLDNAREKQRCLAK